MRINDWNPLEAVLSALSSATGWLLCVAATVVVAFCCGYWIGHRQIMSVAATFDAMLWLPVVWLGQPWMLLAYAVTGLLCWLPSRLESRRWLPLFLAVIFVVWALDVACITRATLHGKFWSW